MITHYYRQDGVNGACSRFFTLRHELIILGLNTANYSEQELDTPAPLSEGNALKFVNSRNAGDTRVKYWIDAP